MARSHLPPGFRFHPTDEELLVHYLKRKVAGKFVDDWIIGEIDIYKYEPGELPGLAVMRSRDSEWFFFNGQDKRNLHGSRTNRTTKAGYWKATGKDRKVTVGSCVGLKKTLIYYVGRAPHGERTDWVMHEYRLTDEVKRKMNSDESFVLCRVRRKSGLGPRNGEQYGAPVLEKEEEEEEEVNNSVNETYVLPSPSVKYLGEKQGQDMLSIATVLEGVRTGMETREDFDSFLQNFASLEEPKQNPWQKGDPVMDELFSLLKDQSDPAVTHAEKANFLDIDSNNMDNFCGLLHPIDSESIMLEDMLHLASGQLVVQPEQPSGMRAPVHNSHMDTLQSVGFLELADLEEPCHEQSTLESAALERLLLELDDSMEFPMSTSLVQDELPMQQFLQPSGHIESIKSLQHVGDIGLNNELEVLLDSSQGLSVLGSVQTRLLTLDNGAVPSGLALISDQEGASVPSNSQKIRNQQQSKAELHRSVGKPLVVSASRADPGANDGGATNDSSNQSVHSSPSPLSPSSFARVISGFLGKVDVLPASADELPLELERHCLTQNAASLCFDAESKARKSAITNSISSSSSKSSQHSRVKLTTLQNQKLNPRTPVLEVQWSVSSTAILNQHCMGSCRRSLTNALSRFLFWITTLALILFYMFRGFCRSTRVAFA